jgi:S1-C subfamily serine protease
VAGVVAGGPAAVAGLRPGDILLAVDGERVEDVEALLRRVTDLDPGSTLEMTGLRNGRPFELRVTVSERPSVPLAR